MEIGRVRSASDQRYRASVKGKATQARARGRQRRREAHLCARPGCGKVVAGKKIGRRRQLCRTCSAAIREIDAGKRRRDAEQLALDDVADVVLREVSAPRGRRVG
jgi:hypothetical protein